MDLSALDVLWPGLVVVGLAVAILPLVNRDHIVVRVLAVAICLALMWRYMVWRFADTLPSTEHPLDFLMGAAFAGAEALYLVGASATMCFLARTRSRSAEADRNLAWLAAQQPAPLIDVLICTYNEGPEVLEPTIVAARATHYANARIWVCDDTRRPWLRDLAARLGVGYLTRPDNTHAKAGNINAALAALAKLEARPDFVAILDADFATLPDFLSRATALMREPDVGVVQTPQHFFNPDPIQHNLSIARVWPDEQRFFFDVIMASKDAWGAAFCCGTSSVIRYDALMAIGGFPTESVTEDYLVSLRLRQRGYRTVYLNERLSLGLAPEGLAEYSAQRSRWCLGFVQICRGPSGPLKLGNGLPLVDRIMLAESFLYWAANHAFRLLTVVAPPLYLLFGVVTVDATVPDTISHLFPFLAALLAINLWLMEWRVLPILTDVYQLLCATDILKAVIAGLTRPKGQKFQVTAKGGDRSRQFIQWPLLRFFLALMALNALGVVNAFWLGRDQPLSDCDAVVLVWSWYNLITLALACFVCVERPRRCDGARFPSDESVEVLWAGGSAVFQAADLSVSGVRLLGRAPVALGAPAQVVIGDIAVQATLARADGQDFSFSLAPSLDDRARLLRRLYSGRYTAAAPKIRPARVARAILARALGAPSPS